MRAGEVGGEPASSSRPGRSSTFLLAAPSPYVIFMGTGALPWISVVVVALGLLWLIVAAAISIFAARRFRLAESVLEAARANATLLELTPARPLLVRPDQKIEADAQLLRDLGLRTQPKVLSDLVGNDSGIAPDDLELLRADVEAARMSAGRVSRRVRAHGSAARIRRPRRAGAGARARGHVVAVVFRHQLERRGAGPARASPAPDRGRAQFAHAPDRGGAISDVVPRAGPQARPRQQRFRSGRRRQGRRPTSSSAAPS